MRILSFIQPTECRQHGDLIKAVSQGLQSAHNTVTSSRLSARAYRVHTTRWPHQGCQPGPTECTQHVDLIKAVSQGLQSAHNTGDLIKAVTKDILSAHNKGDLIKALAKAHKLSTFKQCK